MEDVKMRVPMKSLLVVYSYHHNNTEKIANVIGSVLGSQIKTPMQTDPEAVLRYDLLGFGSGIDSDKHYKVLLDFAENIPQADNKHAFIFSTAGVTSKKKMAKDHSALREKLESRGYRIVDEYQFLGFNTNSFLKYFGGINKGRPNDDDLRQAEAFAEHLKLAYASMFVNKSMYSE